MKWPDGFNAHKKILAFNFDKTLKMDIASGIKKNLNHTFTGPNDCRNVVDNNLARLNKGL